MVCKHGLPITWDCSPQEPWPLDRSYKLKITVTMCKRCAEDGARAAFTQWIEDRVKNFAADGQQAVK